jgi:hypothetical protein
MNYRISNVATTAALAGLLAALMTASPAGAVDGVIEINNARAFAGGVTPGDTPGYPVTISQPGSYRLTGELRSPTGIGIPGIDITSTDVTLDLNGFKISSSVAGCSTPNILSSASATKLYNGTVQCGVQVGPDSHVEGLMIYDGDLVATTNGRIAATTTVIRNRVKGDIRCHGRCAIVENQAANIDPLERGFPAFQLSHCSGNVLAGADEEGAAGCVPAGANLCCDGFGCSSCP